MDFSNFFNPYVFDVKESVFRSFTLPLGSGDLGNPGQLPVSEDWYSGVLSIGSYRFP